MHINLKYILDLTFLLMSIVSYDLTILDRVISKLLVLLYYHEL